MALGYYLVARKGFPSDRDLALALGITPAELVRWKRVGAPSPDAERMLRNLALAVSELSGVYDAELIPAWLTARPAGTDRTAMELLHEGSLAEVLHRINASANGAFS